MITRISLTLTTLTLLLLVMVSAVSAVSKTTSSDFYFSSSNSNATVYSVNSSLNSDLSLVSFDLSKKNSDFEFNSNDESSMLEQSHVAGQQRLMMRAYGFNVSEQSRPSFEFAVEHFNELPFLFTLAQPIAAVQIGPWFVSDNASASPSRICAWKDCNSLYTHLSDFI